MEMKIKREMNERSKVLMSGNVWLVIFTLIMCSGFIFSSSSSSLWLYRKICCFLKSFFLFQRKFLPLFYVWLKAKLLVLVFCYYHRVFMHGNHAMDDKIIGKSLKRTCCLGWRFETWTWFFLEEEFFGNRNIA